MKSKGNTNVGAKYFFAPCFYLTKVHSLRFIPHHGQRNILLAHKRVSSPNTNYGLCNYHFLSHILLLLLNPSNYTIAAPACL